MSNGPGSILVLDLATTTGWAGWTPGYSPRHGLLRMPKGTEDLGYFLEKFKAQVLDLYKVYEPGLIAFELPFVGPKTTQVVARKLFALAGMTEWMAHQWKVECVEVNNATWRKHFFSGFQRPRVGSKGEQREVLKDICIDACRLRGWSPVSDNDADALGILDYVAHVTPRYRDHIDWAPGPIFANRAA